MFGEAGLVTDVVRESSVSALTTCRVLLFERAGLTIDDANDPNARERGRQHIVRSLEQAEEFVDLKHSVIIGMLAKVRNPRFQCMLLALVRSHSVTLASTWLSGRCHSLGL
jgi:hypothetical protein